MKGPVISPSNIMVGCAAAGALYYRERWRESGKHDIESNRRGLAVLLLILSVSECDAGYSGSKREFAGCFVHPGKMKHRSYIYGHDLMPLSSSTKEEYYYDAFQDDMTRERRSKHPQSRTSLMKYKVRKKKRNKKLRDLFYIESNAANGGIKRRERIKQKQSKRRRSSKSLPTSTVAQLVTRKSIGSIKQTTQLLPPWLAQYENDDFDQQKYDQSDAPEPAPLPISYSDEIFAAQKLKHLEQELHQATSFNLNEIYDVLDSVRIASQNSVKLVMGCADFLYLMLTLEEHDDMVGGDYVPKTLIMTREVLVAAAFHYCDCVRARKAGVYDVVKAFMEASDTGKLLPGYHQNIQDDQQSDNLAWLPQSESTGSKHEIKDATITVKNRMDSSIQLYGEDAVRIARGAAKLKRVEVMATTVNGKYLSGNSLESSNRMRSKSVNAGSLSSDASILRSFLVSISEDWGALVIRSAACLYRLKGIVDESNHSNIRRRSNSRLVHSSTSMQTARDALKVYAPLAQRMGMQRLKSQIENTAFRILYPRQYDVSSVRSCYFENHVIST